MKVKKLGTDFYVTLATILTFGFSFVIYMINFALLEKYGDNPAYRDVPTIFAFFYSFMAFFVYIILFITSLCNGLAESLLTTKKKIGRWIIGFDILLAAGNILIPLSALIYIIVNP